ncbi:MAG: homocysteine S-methyltransferase family protein [Bacteroidales bacterium]|nr:homocysteine S-methyltransferase family protein [Bacteroidales bacterium]
MGKILDRLKGGNILVSDGAWGTFLHQRGLSTDECPESWNLTRPDDVFEIARSYVEAGADIILTNSFGGSPFKLEPYGLKDQVYKINRAAAEISRKAAEDKVMVLGSMGPTGKMVFMGEISEEELLEGFKEQARGLIEGGVDGLLVETMSDIQESTLAVKAAKSVSDLEVVCTFTFERTQSNEYRTMMGTTVAEAVESARTADADIIGANCGNGIAGMVDIVREIRKMEKNLPILVHANAGLPHYQDGQTVFPETPVEMASQAKSLVEAGANIVGGCCGTTPEHIRLILQAVKPGKHAI